MEWKEETIGGNGVGIMRYEMRRKDNKESSSKASDSCLFILKLLPLLTVTQLMWLFIHFGGQVMRMSHLCRKSEILCET